MCTRYFGGVKLGTGGLRRAYSSGVKLALDALPTEPKIDRVAVEIVIGYENVSDLHRIMTEMKVLVEAEEYGERVVFRGRGGRHQRVWIGDDELEAAPLDIHPFHGRFDLPESRKAVDRLRWHGPLYSFNRLLDPS